MKTCKHCGGSFEGKFCKPCKSKYLKKYREENKEKVYATELAWRAANNEKVKATRERWKARNPLSNKEYYDKKKDVIKARTKEWYKSNKERAAEYKKEYYKNNPECRANGKAKRRMLIGFDRLPYGTVPSLYKKQNGLCACCNTPLNGKYHVDHIMPISLGGKNIPSNVQLLLPICNLRKSAKHPDIWRNEIQNR